MRTPQYRGQFLPSQIPHLYTFQLLKSGHPEVSRLDVAVGLYWGFLGHSK